jgi:hypothetical protein
MMAAKAQTKGFWGGEEPEWIVVATVVLALALGGVLMAVATTRATSASLGAMHWRYPAAWGQEEAAATAWSASGLGTATYGAVTVLRDLDPAAPVSLDDLVAQRGFDQAGAHALYRVLATERTKVGGRSAVALRYAYVRDNAAIGVGALPVVVEGEDYIIPYQGRVYLLTLEAEADALAGQQPAFDRLVRSVRFE